MGFKRARPLNARAKTYSQAVGVALLMTGGLIYPGRVCRGVE